MDMEKPITEAQTIKAVMERIKPQLNTYGKTFPGHADLYFSGVKVSFRAHKNDDGEIYALITGVTRI